MFLNPTSNEKKKHGGVKLFDQNLFLRWLVRPGTFPADGAEVGSLSHELTTPQKDWMGHPSIPKHTCWQVQNSLHMLP
jgi:hypothetical protein